MMKLGTITDHQKNIQKCINHVAQHLSSTGISNFVPKTNNSCYIENYRQKLHFYTFLLYYQHDCNFDEVSKIDYSRPP